MRSAPPSALSVKAFLNHVWQKYFTTTSRPPDPDPPRPPLQPEQQRQPGRAAAAASVQQASVRLQSAQPARCRTVGRKISAHVENIAACPGPGYPGPSSAYLPPPQFADGQHPGSMPGRYLLNNYTMSTEYLLYLQTVYYLPLILSTLQRVLSGL